jgi:hypothetical protein
LTLASNTSVTSSAPSKSENLVKIAGNLFDTIVPGWVRGNPGNWPQPNASGLMRDDAFAFYQLNLIFAMGLLGGPLIVALVLWKFVRGGAESELGFWRALIPFCLLVGVAVVGERDHLGVPHLTLLSLEVLGLCYLASMLPRFPRSLRVAVVAFCCVDFAFGVYLQARIESLENTPEYTVFTDLHYYPDGVHRDNPTELSLSDAAWGNWSAKHQLEIYRRWLRDLPVGHDADPTFQAQWAKGKPLLLDGVRDLEVNWGGWPDRHGGVIAYLGDSVARLGGFGTDLASGVVLLMFVSGCALMIWMPQPAGESVTAEKSPAASRRPLPKQSRARK